MSTSLKFFRYFRVSQLFFKELEYIERRYLEYILQNLHILQLKKLFTKFKKVNRSVIISTRIMRVLGDNRPCLWINKIYSYDLKKYIYTSIVCKSLPSAYG